MSTNVPVQSKAAETGKNIDMFEKAPHAEKTRRLVGVLLVALGTPDAPTPKALRRYLAEFLSDPRVVEVPKLLWLPILYGPILTFRPAKSAKAYAKIWNRDRNESPLRTFTRAQSDKLAQRLSAEFGDTVLVNWAFRYGTPSIGQKLSDMLDGGVDRLLVFPLYPHYSATTTASVQDKLADEMKKLRWQPAIRTVPPYYDRPDYIEALAGSVSSSLEKLDWKPEIILASYHSIPKAYWDKGDPYACHCFKTTRLLGEKLGLGPDKLISTFQSRVGTQEWIGPYSDRKIKELAREGVRRIAVLAPAFSSDCVETLEEINLELRETFEKEGGTHFHYIPCLNDSDAGMDVLEAIVRTELGGWT